MPQAKARNWSAAEVERVRREVAVITRLVHGDEESIQRYFFEPRIRAWLVAIRDRHGMAAATELMTILEQHFAAKHEDATDVRKLTPTERYTHLTDEYLNSFVDTLNLGQKALADASLMAVDTGRSS